MRLTLCSRIHVCCAGNQLSLLLGPYYRVKPQLGPVLPLPLADQSSNPSLAFSHQMDWQPCCSNCTIASSQHSTGLSLQLTITGDSRQLQRGVQGGQGPSNQPPQFLFYRGYIFESFICVFEMLYLTDPVQPGLFYKQPRHPFIN